MPGEGGPADGHDLPIVDAHQHFWDLERHYYPWLCDPELIPFRYGDYSALRRNYLPDDFRRDTRAWRASSSEDSRGLHSSRSPFFHFGSASTSSGSGVPNAYDRYR